MREAAAQHPKGQSPLSGLRYSFVEAVWPHGLSKEKAVEF